MNWLNTETGFKLGEHVPQITSHEQYHNVGFTTVAIWASHALGYGHTKSEMGLARMAESEVLRLCGPTVSKLQQVGWREFPWQCTCQAPRVFWYPHPLQCNVSSIAVPLIGGIPNAGGQRNLSY